MGFYINQIYQNRLLKKIHKHGLNLSRFAYDVPYLLVKPESCYFTRNLFYLNAISSRHSAKTVALYICGSTIRQANNKHCARAAASLAAPAWPIKLLRRSKCARDVHCHSTAARLPPSMLKPLPSIFVVRLSCKSVMGIARALPLASLHPLGQ